MSFGLKLLALLGRVASGIFLLFPIKLRFFFGDLLGRLWFDVFRIRRKVVLSNLQIAYPHLTEKERVRLGRKSLFHLGRDLMEYPELPFLNLAKVKSRFVVEGEHHLQEALQLKKGVCLLTLHLGNGDLGIAALSMLGYPISLLSKEFKARWLNDLWFGMRARLGTQFIPPRNSSYAVLKALKKGRVVMFVQDQYMGPPQGVKTTFFGQETGTGLGLATIAWRAGCPVVPVYTLRQGPHRHLIHFDKPVEMAVGINPDESLKIFTQRCNDILEQYVRRCPEQWMWIHKRWKPFSSLR
ncbi:MAG: lysophospholipid acyltransferase family protein, partial [Bdellovibrionales bacterium]|nr:lysophospholipid acyltransferase family protein [Bdellovibrionales bacterium]